MPERVTVYFDYICPYSWRAAEVLELVAEPLGLTVTWEHFSLYQHSYELNGADRGGNGRWQLWNEPIDELDGNGCKGLLPFLASQAARRQGPEAHHGFRLALQRAVHRDYRSLDMATILAVADEVGLHKPRFEDDLANPECRTVLAQEHTRAAALDLFGTPTVVFPGGEAAYFRLQELPRSREEAVSLFQETRGLLERYPYLQTVRRPRGKGN
ncbi:MAG: DsbA family protein [Deinococcales bacterium]|nr:DsbA family protein [Deinococcales bacterium]